MGLNLNEFLPEDEIITFGKKKFKITASIPTDLIFEFDELKTITNDMSKENIDKIKNLMKKILYIKNKKEEVDKFIDEMNFISLIKVVVFISEYIKSAIEDTSKKKDLNQSVNN